MNKKSICQKKKKVALNDREKNYDNVHFKRFEVSVTSARNFIVG